MELKTVQDVFKNAASLIRKYGWFDDNPCNHDTRYCVMWAVQNVRGIYHPEKILLYRDALDILRKYLETNDPVYVNHGHGLTELSGKTRCWKLWTS
jgi:hypothetical protein